MGVVAFRRHYRRVRHSIVGRRHAGTFSASKRRGTRGLPGGGLDTLQVFTADDLVPSDELFFAATGITDGPLLAGVRYQGQQAETHSLLLRCETHTRRQIHAEHLLEEGL
jgi:fructose-1,6-bisphosphatase II